MHSHSIDDFRHSHHFLGEAHERNERKTWIVIAICTAMMIAEIVGGWWFGSVALIADGLHMSTHAGALLIAALAYTYSRRYARDERLAFGTGKFGDLAAFTSAIALAIIALLIGYESVDRFLNPVPIAFNQAIPIAVLGLGINLLSAFLLRDDHDHHRPLPSRPQFAGCLRACHGGCSGFGARHHRLGRGAAIRMALDGPVDGFGCNRRYSELVMDACPLGRRNPS